VSWNGVSCIPGGAGEGVDGVLEGEAVDGLQDGDHRVGENRRCLGDPAEQPGSGGRTQCPEQGDDSGDDDQAGGELAGVHGDPVVRGAYSATTAW
jgi:hypothetical protein